MKSFLDSTELKDNMIKELNWHKKQDAFFQRTYGEGSGDNFRGCAVGCSINSLNRLNGTKLRKNDHKAYEKHLGLPEWLARLEDTIFEGLPVEEAKKWPLQFIKAIPVGVDLEKVKYQFSIYLMNENLKRVKSLDIDDSLKKQVLAAIRRVKRVHKTALDAGIWDEYAARSAAESAAWSAARSAWSAAWSAARSAAESAARSAAESAESAARSAARSAESAARSAWSAAWSAARSAAESAARSAAESAESAESAAYIKHSKKLLTLLRKAGE